MNRRVVVALAVVGVTVGTVAAALATNAAFSTNEDSSAAAAVAGIGTVPELTTTASRSASGPVGSGSAAAGSHTYSVRSAGRVVVRRKGSQLEIVEVVTAPGWMAQGQTAASRQGVPYVEVTFVRANRGIVFTALLLDDEIITRIEDRDESSPNDDGDGQGDDVATTSATSGGGRTTIRTSDDRGGSTSPTADPHSDDDGLGNGSGHGGSATSEPTEPTEPPEPVEVEH